MIGYVQQDFTVVFQAWLVGVVLSVIVRLRFTVYGLLFTVYGLRSALSCRFVVVLNVDDDEDVDPCKDSVKTARNFVVRSDPIHSTADLEYRYR